MGAAPKRQNPKPPPAAPDLTDEVIRAAAEAEARRLQTGRTRRSTFLGSLGPSSPTRGSLLGGS